MSKILIFVVITLFSQVLSKQIKSAWIDTSECPDYETTVNLIKILFENGINRVYVDAWQQGQVFHTSGTMEKAIGEKGIGRPIIEWFVQVAKKQYGMEVYGWYEFGYIAAMTTMQTRFGSYAIMHGWVMGQCDDFYYMDPRTKATEFLAGIMSDGITAGLDGVQLDDHFACPPKFSQCSADVLLQAAKYIKEFIKSRHGNSAILSLAPAPMAMAIRDYRVEWRVMMLNGYFDEIVPLLYTPSYEDFSNELTKHEQYWPEYRNKVLIGVMVNQDGGHLTPWETALKMIKLTEQKGYNIVIWYGKSIAIDYRKEFHEIWGH